MRITIRAKARVNAATKGINAISSVGTNADEQECNRSGKLSVTNDRKRKICNHEDGRCIRYTSLLAFVRTNKLSSIVHCTYTFAPVPQGRTLTHTHTHPHAQTAEANFYSKHKVLL